MDSLKKLRSLLKKQQVDAILISSVPNIIYITEYSGFSQTEREAYLLVTQKNAFLFVSALHIEEVKKDAKNVTIIERTRDNPLKKILSDLVKKYNLNTCGFEKENLVVAEYDAFNSIFPKFSVSDLSDLRLIKTQEEINKIKQASELGDKAYSHVLKNIRIGMTEKEVSLELEMFIRKSGNDISFAPVIAFEEYAAVPHHNSGNRKLKKNNLVLLDFGAKVDNYCSDMTRVFFVGIATREQKKVYEMTVAAQEKSINYIKEQLSKNKKPIATLVDSIARDFVVDNGYPPFNHSSHGIGLEVHENPHITGSEKPLENGMVFSIEPGIYLPGKFGVRIEDLFAIQNNKLIPLTHSPKELIEIN